MSLATVSHLGEIRPFISHMYTMREDRSEQIGDYDVNSQRTYLLHLIVRLNMSEVRFSEPSDFGVDSDNRRLE